MNSLAVTITNVADRAGVSKSTVSQYLNKRYNFMSAETKKRIQIAIEELNYQPNQIARSLKQKKTNLIAIVASNLFSRFTVELVSSIESEVSKYGYEVILSTTDDDPDKELEYLQSFIARQVDGVLVFPTINNKEYYQQLAKDHYPLVFVDRFIDEVPVDAVLLDNFLAGKLAAQNLIENGHEKIGIVLYPMGSENSITPRKQRLEGYKAALSENGIEVSDEYIKSGRREKIPDLIDELFKEENQLTAIIAGNDVILEALLLRMKERDLKIPIDYSVVGIDDVSFARFFSPAITTVSQPVKRMGAEAARLLLEKIKKVEDPNRSDEEDEIVLRLIPKIIQRESVKDLKVEKDY